MINTKQVLYIFVFLAIKTTALLSLLVMKFRGWYSIVPNATNPKINREISVHELQPDIVEYDNCNLKKYLENSIPVIVENVDSKSLTYFKNKTITEKQFTDGNIFIKSNGIIETMQTNIGKWVLTKSRRPIIMSSIFTGKYRSGISHIDVMPSYNFYTMLEGTKEVLIIPIEFESYVDLNNGIHNIHVSNEPKGEHKIENLPWLQNIPYYYRFDLQPNQMLIFNNSANIHKFINKNDITKALTIRVLDIFGTNSIQVLQNQLTNSDIQKVSMDYIVKKMDDNPANRY